MARSRTSKALALVFCLLSVPAFAQTPIVGRLGSGIPKGVEPPAVGGGGTYSVAYTVNTTGWLTVPIAAAQGEIPSGNGVSIGGLTTQLDVKNKWPDNSAKLAILTAKLASTGSKTIVSASAPGGSFTPTAPVFSVQFVVTAGSGSGNTYTAALGSYTSADKWLTGPNAIEWRKQVTPTTGGSVAHANLSVIFDVRSYVDGDHRINVQVLNARDNANMDNTTYSATFINSGVTVYTAPASMKQYTFTQWQQIVYLGAGQEATVTLDFSKFYSTAQIPKPLPGLPNTDYTADLADTSKFAPTKFGLISPELASPGASGHLGPMSVWDMRFLVNQSVSQRAVILHHAFNAIGAFTQSRTQRSDDSNYRLDDATDGGLYAVALDNTYPAVLRTPRAFNPLEGNYYYRGARNFDNAGWRFDFEHIPQVSLAAYMATGDRAYVDSAKAFASSVIFCANPYEIDYPEPGTDGVTIIRTDRHAIGAIGNSMSQTGGGDPRMMARTIRNIIYAAQMVPDADPERSYWLRLVNDNMAWFAYYNDSYRLAPGNQWGDGAVLFEGTTGMTISGTTKAVFIQSFGNAEIAWDIYWANLQGVFTVPAGAISFAKRVVGLYVVMANQTGYLTEPGRLGEYYPQVAKRLGPIGVGAIELPATYADFAALFDLAQWPQATLGYVVGGTGVHTLMAVKLAIYWGITNAAAAKTIVDAYGPGAIEADAVNTQNNYALVIPQ